MKITVRNKTNYALGSNKKNQAAVLAETQRNIFAMNANERIAEKDAATTLERDRIKADQTTKVVTVAVAVILIFIILKYS